MRVGILNNGADEFLVGVGDLGRIDEVDTVSSRC